MKKSLSACFLLCLFFNIPLSGQQSKPTIIFAEKDHDFGTFRESDGIISHDFTFTNTGKVPLIIEDVKASCGCTTPQWTNEPLLPGKSGNIRVSFDPKQRPGSFNKTIQVTSNADVPSVTLLIQGVVIPVDNVEDVYKFTVGQLRLQTIYVAFGEVFKGNTAEFSIKVMNTSSDVPAKPSFGQVPPYLKITIVPEIIEPQQEGKILIEYNSSLQKDWDYTVNRLEMLINGQSVPGNRISITANIKENFKDLTAEELSMAPVVEFEQTSYDFGTVTPDKIVEHVFKLTNRGKSSLFIRKVSASCGCTAVQPEKTVVGAGESIQIKATFNAAGREGNQKKAITVITSDPKRSKTILWLTGIVSKPGQSLINP
jgi:hypothetical protein